MNEIQCFCLRDTVSHNAGLYSLRLASLRSISVAMRVMMVPL
jgi:hypothetical protein